jgi:hypothetical protein
MVFYEFSFKLSSFLNFQGKFFDAEQSILKLTNDVVPLIKEIKESLKSLKIEITSTDNDIKKQAEDNFKLLKLEMTSSVNELKKEMSSFKKLNPFLFGAPYGIQNNVHVSKLTEIGYSFVYNKPYNHFTTSSEMDEIKSSCLPTTNICLGGRDSTNDVLLVVSCGLCSVVFTKTARNTPNLHNGAYWYYSPDVENSRSMGFAPNSTIDQRNPDDFDLSNNQRVSWSLKWGGYRLGSLIYPGDRYYKVILKRDD